VSCGISFAQRSSKGSISSVSAGGRRTFIRAMPRSRLRFKRSRSSGRTAQRHRQRARVPAGFFGHLAPARHELFRAAGTRARRCRQYPAAVAERTPRGEAEGADDDDRRVRLLRRLGPAVHWREIDDLAVIFCDVLRPDLLHRLDLLAHLEGAGLVDIISSIERIVALCGVAPTRSAKHMWTEWVARNTWVCNRKETPWRFVGRSTRSIQKSPDPWTYESWAISHSRTRRNLLPRSKS
jgi:hypothetical protein